MSKLTLISSATASGASNVSFTSGIDSTYDEYVFYFVDVNPATNGSEFQFQVNADGQTGFNETITSTFFRAGHDEANTHTFLSYDTGSDQAQGTAYQRLSTQVGNGADESCSGELHLFNPASTTYVKHFMAEVNEYQSNDYSIDQFLAGSINTTSAIDEIDFKMSSGNFDGNIYMFGAS
jgi:hypothetical protein